MSQTALNPVPMVLRTFINKYGDAQFSDAEPAPPLGADNVTWQTDGFGKISAYTNASSLSGVGSSATLVASTYANNAISENRFSFTDGSGDYYSAGPIYRSNGIYIDDFYLSVVANPSAFDTPTILNIVSKFISLKNGIGEFPCSILPDTTAPSYLFYSGYDQHQTHASGDGWICVPLLMYEAWKRDGDLTFYKDNIAAIRTALSVIPRNPVTKLVTVNTGDEYVAGTLFMEIMRNTGDVANANVWYMKVCEAMAALANAAGDIANNQFFESEFAAVDSSVKSELIDPTTGLLITASEQNNGNLDVQTSALWVFSGYGTPAQRLAIANYFSSNFTTLVNPYGYVLNSPITWQVVGIIPADGGAPYNPITQFSVGQYQWGYWSHDFQWFATTLALVAPDKAQQMLLNFLNGPNPQTEWFALNSQFPQGTSPNMESPQGALAYAKSINAIFPVTVAPTRHGTPTITTSDGGSIPDQTGSWTCDDTAFTLVLDPPSDVGPGATIASIQFGNPFVDGWGDPVLPNMQITPRLESAAGIVVWLDSDVGQNMFVKLGPSQGLSAGTTYAWMISVKSL